MNDIDPLNVICETCGAAVGHHCQPRPGGAARAPHARRILDARYKAAQARQAERIFPSRDGKPGDVWVGGLDSSAPIDIESTGRVQFVTEDNVISVYFDLDGNLVINGDRSYNIELAASNCIRIVKR